MADNNFDTQHWTRILRIVFWMVLLIGLAMIIFSLLRRENVVVRNPGAYYAVFLDNDQVYFGKLKAADRDLWSLTDVYYLRAGPVLQGGEEEEGRRLDLIKLGSELHAPLDEMFISREHVIFYEEISEQSQVRELIRTHKSGGR